MKNTQLFLFTLIPCLSYGATDSCMTAKILTQIRPGAEWAMQGDSTDHLKWLDKKQAEPSKTEIEKAKQACTADLMSRKALKDQAQQELKNPATPVEKKVQDLILMLDLDK